MNANDFVLLALHAMGGVIRGKTKLQKNVYFLGVMTGHVDDLGYRPHFYGPYSDEVADATSRLKAVGFIDQSVVTIGAVGRFGFEMTRTDFALTKDGQQIAEEKAKAMPELWEKIRHDADTLGKAGDLDYMKLSIAAKTYFMLGEKKDKATMAELVDLANGFGWKVTKHRVEEAANYLKKLGLVEIE